MVISPVHFPFWPKKQKTQDVSSSKFDGVFYFDRGTSALKEGLMAILREKNKAELKVLFPDYFCKEPLEILKHLPFSIDFYPTQKNFEPDWEKVETLFKTKQTDVFILVHYFGFPNNLERAKEVCDKFSVALVEDCAHVLQPFGKVGSTGILSIFSPWKFLSLNDLGLLKTEDRLTVYVQPAKNYFAIVPFFRWVLKRKIQQTLCFLNINWYKRKKISGSGNFDNCSAVNGWSIKLFNIYKKEINLIANQRRENYFFLESSVKKNYQGGLICGNLSEGVVPYSFPLICKKSAKIYVDKLIQNGIPASLWPDLAKEVRSNPTNYPWANFYADHLLLFPIHQSITERGMRYTERQVRSLFYDKN